MEIGQLFFAFRHGALRKKLAAMGFFLSLKNLSRLIRLRREVQRRRLIEDRAFMRTFTPVIEFAELKSALLTKIANPLLRVYWRIARRLMFW
jgi:hypothetical protein